MSLAALQRQLEAAAAAIAELDAIGARVRTTVCSTTLPSAGLLLDDGGALERWLDARHHGWIDDGTWCHTQAWQVRISWPAPARTAQTQTAAAPAASTH